MFKKMSYVLSMTVLFAMGLVLMGCSNAQVETFVDPQISIATVKKVAIFPFENARLTPAQSLEINKKVSLALHKANPEVEIISPATVMATIGDGFTEKWAWFIRDYDTSGIPNTKTLHEIGTALGADAIVQGRLTGIKEQDGSFGFSGGKTEATISYAMFSTQGKDARLLWSSSCKAKKTSATVFSSTPALYKVLNIAIDKILKTLK